jgi:hypothetical protein
VQASNRRFMIGSPPSVVGGLPAAAVSLSRNAWLLLVVAATVALCLPFLRFVDWLGDEGVLLHGATRILDGQRLYIDFFEFLPPGGFMLTAGWFKLVGISIVSARALAILTVVGIACFTYRTCHLVSQNAPLSALFTIGWVVMSQGHWTGIHHHWFTTLLSMMAAWAAVASTEYQQFPLRLALIGGAVAGMAAMVTPTRGLLAAIAVLLAYFRPRTRPGRVGCLRDRLCIGAPEPCWLRDLDGRTGYGIL